MPPQLTNNIIQHLPHNSIGRDFVVGDLHGCLEELLLLMRLIKFNEGTDRLFSVGDLIDRGPYSKECAELIYKPWFFAVRGNHEQMMIDSLINNQDIGMWMINGGLWYYNEDEANMISLAHDLNTLPVVIVVGDGVDRFNVVHAEFVKQDHNTGRRIKWTDMMISHGGFSPTDINQMLWGRTIISNSQKSIDQVRDDELWHDMSRMSTTFVGHTPVRFPVQCQKQMYLDNGAVYHHTSQNKSEANQLILACPTEQKLYMYNMVWRTVQELPFSEVQKIG